MKTEKDYKNLKYKVFVELKVPLEDLKKAPDELQRQIEASMAHLERDGWDISWTFHPCLENTRMEYEGGSLQCRRLLTAYASNWDGHQ